MAKSIGMALTQIATLYDIGFRHFEIIQGMTGPVGTLKPPYLWGWGLYRYRKSR